MKYLKTLFSINIITIFLNFKYFNFNDAIKFPILLYGKISVYSLKGKIELKGKIKTGLIQIGKSQVGIFDKKAKTILNIHGTIIFEGKANIGKGSSLSIGKNSILRIGDNFTISAKSAIICSGGKNITFGKNNLLSWDILVINTDFHKILNQNTKEILNSPQDITIGDNVWIGFNTKIFKKSIISDNCIIGANSTVTKFIDEPNSIYAGNPIKRIRGNVTWKD
jgi:acetyltransferase-like isoleucine patch superfamily enzyme